MTVDRLIRNQARLAADHIGPRSWSPGVWLVLIIGLSAVVRLVIALTMGDRVEILPGIYDQVSYDALARRVLTGHGFTFDTMWWPATAAGQPTAHWSFLYTLYLAVVYALFGPHPLVARLIQALVVGVATPWLAYRLGRRTFGTGAGLAAAAITAGYAYLAYYGGALLTESFYIVAVLWVLDVALQLAERPSMRGMVLLGLALGVAVLLRQLLLLFIPCLFVWLLLEGRGRVRWRHLAVTLAVVVILILPWTARNYRAFGRFVLLNTNSGFAFFWANHPIYGANFVPILPRDGPSYQELIPQELIGHNEAALEAELLRRGVGFVLNDPIRYALLSLSRVREYFKFWPSPDSGPLSNVARVLSFGICLPFMLYGLYLSAARWRRCALLYVFIVFYTTLHVLSWALIRYRLPVDAVLILFAGAALADLAARVSILRAAQPASAPAGATVLGERRSSDVAHQ